MKKRILSIVLSIVMLVSLLPTTALAFHSHCVCGGSVTVGGHTHDSTAPTWEAWDGTDKDGETDGIQLTAGSYYLTGDVEVNSVTIVGEVNLCLNGRTITTTNGYGAFHVKSGATLNICDCSTSLPGKIENTNASTDYPGIRNNGGTVNVYGGTVSGAHTGIINKNNNGGTVNVYGGTVSGAHTGIKNEQKSNLNIYNGTAQVTGSTGYGIYNQGTVSVSGGSVTGGSNGIYNYHTGTINVSGTVQVSGSTAIYNGGGTLTVSGGTVTATGSSGSGIDNSGTGGTLTVSGGTVTANNGSSKGISNSGTLNLQGAPSITGAAADIYLKSDKLITIGEGGLTYTSDKAISVYMDTPGTFTSGWKSNMVGNADNYGSYFTSAMDGYTVQPDGNELKLAEPSAAETHSHDNCGVANCTNTTHNHSEVDEWTELTKENIKTYVRKSGSSYILTPGSYYLGEDITLSDVANDCTFIYMNASGTYNVCLNGNTITGSGSAPVFRANDTNAVLSICDCSEPSTGKITGGYNQSGGGVCIDYGTVNLYGGSITGNSAYQQGAGVYVTNGTFNMYGGSISNNTFTSDSDRKGGGVHVSSGTFNMYGGTISDHVSSNGGGVYVASGTFNMSGGTISGNTASTYGGGVYVYSGTFTMTGGKITGNSASRQCGGVYNRVGTFNVSGSPVVTDNTVGTAENNVYCINEITITGTLTADAQIGVNYLSETTFTSGWTAVMGESETDYEKYFTSDNSGFEIVKNDSGELELKKSTIPVTDVVLDKSSITLDVNDTATLTATVLPDDATDKSVSWESSDPTVATVENGEVTALKPGSTTITATTTDGSLTDTCEVTVNKIAITGTIAITTTQEPTVGQTFDLNCIVIPTGNYSYTAKAIAPNASIEAGKNYILSIGLKPNDGYYFADGVAATINGKAATVVRSGDNISIQYTYSFASPAANSVDILQYEIPVTTVPIVLPGIEQADVVLPFTAKVLDQYGHEMTGQTIEWRITGTNTTGISVNNDTVTVTKDAAVGSYTLTATCDGKSDSITIQVKKAESVLTTVKIFDGGGSGKEITTVDRTIPDVGSKSYINSAAKGYDQYGELMTGLSFAWSNTNTDSEISLVDGFVTIGSGAQEGSFSYTATCNGKSATVTVNLTKKMFTVTYTDNVANETVFSDVQLSVQSGGNAPAYPDGTPSRTGYIFDGWYTSTDGGATLSASAYDFETPMTGNLTLYAKWTEKATVSINDAVQTYTWNGSGKSFEITDTPNTGFTVQYKVNGNWTTTAPSAVGTYDVKITRAEDNTYKAYEKEITGGLVINAAAPNYTAPTAKTGLEYTGQPQTLVNVTSTTGGTMYYAIGDKNSPTGTWSTSIPTKTDAGSYYVWYKIVGEAGYTDVGQACVPVTIAPKKVDEPTVNDSYTYTGSEQTVALTGFDGSYMTITGGNKGTNAGGYEVVITLDSNHIWKDGFDGKVQWSIDKAEPTVTWPTGTAYVKDTSVTLTNGSAAGVGGENVDGRFTLDTIDLTSAGEKTVTITFTPTDTNYGGVVKMDYTVTVSKRIVESAAEQTPITNVVYGTEQDALGLPAYVEITVSGNKKFTVPVTWSGYDKTNLNAQNLIGTLDLSAIADEVENTNNVTASIVVDLQEKNAAAFSYKNKTETYNGSSISHEISGTLEGVASISYSYVGTGETEYAASSTAPVNAGSYKVTATFTMQLGYAAVAPKTATLTISPKEVGLDWSELTGEELVYSGTAKTLTATATGLADGDSCTVTVELVDDNINVGTFSYKATALSNANYKLSADVNSPEYTIMPKTLTITAEDKEAYVGSRQPELTYTVDGLVGTDTLTTAPTLSTDANMYRAGTYAITFASEAAAGNNYSITYVNGTLTVKNYPYIPQPTYDVEIADDITGGEVSASKKLAYSGDTITITVVPDAGYELTKLTVTDSRGNAVAVTKISDSKYTFKMPGYDVEIDAVFAKIDTTCPGDSSCPMYPYTDLYTSLWYHDGIHYCIEHGLMVGTGTNIFEPNIATSRAMIVTILWRLEGSPIVNYAMDFEDVAADQWYTEAIRWAASEKIVEGYGNGQFGTNDAITREQMVTIMWRYAKYKGYDVSVGENTNILSYDDAFDVAEWAIPAMQWACGSGMIQGIADGNQMNLAPQGNATRAQAAAILQRYCENVANKD